MGHLASGWVFTSTIWTPSESSSCCPTRLLDVEIVEHLSYVA
jgi:hypothetical protein